MTDEFNPARLGDFVFFCDICGIKEWSSKATKLAPQTGRGGAIVCPRCIDAVDYGQIPYKVPAEVPVPWARIDGLYIAPPNQIPEQYPPYNFAIPPGAGNPGYYASAYSTWDKQVFVTFDQWLVTTWDQILPTS